MYGVTRGLMTLIGAAAAGFLVWLAAWIDPSDSTGEYWAGMGLLAAAGLVMALSQLLGGWTKWGVPGVSGNVFGLAFLPVLVVGGWVLVAAQPDGNAARERVRDWSADIGVGGIVDDLGALAAVVAFGLGLVLGLVLDTSGPRRREAVVEPDRRLAEEPTAAERAHVAAAQEAPAGTAREPVTTEEPGGQPRRRLFRR